MEAGFTHRLQVIFSELDRRIAELNQERSQTGGPKIARAEVRLLGQMSLLANDSIAHLIALAETGDIDAQLKTEYVVNRELRAILKRHGLVYDELSNEIWIPPGATFEPLFDFANVQVSRIDPQSALLSKAVKAPEKNKVLIQDALATGMFPTLAEKIEQNGGNLDYFLNGEEA